MKSTMFPFSILSETIEKSGGVSVTPINGRIFSCWSHFHPMTSLTRSLGSSSMSNPFDGRDRAAYPVCLPGVRGGGKLESFYSNEAPIQGRLVDV